MPGLYTISSSRVHASDAALGSRPLAAPGISSERAEALAAGANRLGYGEYWLRNGRVEARLTLDDVPSGETRVMTASAPDVPTAAGALARQISSRASSYGTRNSAAVQAYVLGMEATDPQVAAQHFQESIRADPDFEPPYAYLAQSKVQQRDQSGATALLEQAMAHRDRMPEIDRAQLEFDAANVSGNMASRQRALAGLARLTPNDPAVWSSMGEAAMSRQDYRQSVEAYQKALSLQPEDFAILNQLGYASAYAGDLQAAVRALQQCETLRPADANPLDSLGDVNLLYGRLREAENFYLQAAKKDPAFLGGGDLRKAAMARLMSGDIAGAGALARQYREHRAQLRDPLVDYYQAEWLWISGSRKEGFQRLEDFARHVENGPLKEAAAEAYGELAVWRVALGDRTGGAQFAQKAERIGGTASEPTIGVARFLAQPSASATEWPARAERAFPNPAQKPIKERALVFALLVDRQFPAALEILKSMYQNGGPTADDVPLLLAWCYLETGRPQDAAGLLRFNPLPAAAGVQPFQSFYFPRIFYLRGRVAMAAGQGDAARAQYRLFLQLSGDSPLVWAEEAQAR